MATSLLRLGRLGTLKCLQQDGWGCLRTPLSAAFCTKTEAPKKPAKKASTLEAPDERAALLAYKTTVAFPTRISTPGFLSQGVALGEYDKQSRDPVTGESSVAAGASTSQVSREALIEETVAKQAESVADDSVQAKTESCDVSAPTKATPIAETSRNKDAASPTSAGVKEPEEGDATSSSSSSSDSDSDSDSDDEKPETELNKPVAQTEDKAGQEEIPSAAREEKTSHVKTKAVPEPVQPSVPEGSPKISPVGAAEGSPVGSPQGISEVREAVSQTTAEKVPGSRAAAASSEEIVDPAPVSCTAQSVQTQAEVIPETKADVQVKSSEVYDAIDEPVTDTAPGIASQPRQHAILHSATEVASEPEVEIKAAPETTESVAAGEELVDPAPLITDADVIQAEPEPEAAAAPEEAAPALEPEPFNNTTYMNLQHHNYNNYTFVDMDVEMAKHRLPQPSTGRPSPRH